MFGIAAVTRQIVNIHLEDLEHNISWLGRFGICQGAVVLVGSQGFGRYAGQRVLAPLMNSLDLSWTS